MNQQQVSAEEMDGMLNRAFSEYDTDNSGYIDSRELRNLCESLNTPINESDGDEAVRMLDTSGSGKIELFEFKNWWLGKIVFANEQEQQNRVSSQLRTAGEKGKNRLLQAKLARKQAEADAQLLANRIALLQQEEAKAWKKIQQTKQRATEILETREQHERKEKNAAEFRFQEAEITRKAQETRFVQKQRDKVNRQKAQALIVKKKQQEVANMRKFRRQNEIEKQRQLQAKQEANGFNVQVVKQHHANMRAYKQKKLEDQQRANELSYKRKVDTEEVRTRSKENEVQAMEREEMELIQRLQNAQMLQKEAYEELEGALGTA